MAQKKGRLWCKYPCEEQRLYKAVLDIKSVYAHHELLMILHNLQANLSFPKNVVHLGLHILVQQCDDVFKLREERKRWRRIDITKGEYLTASQPIMTDGGWQDNVAVAGAARLITLNLAMGEPFG